MEKSVTSIYYSDDFTKYYDRKAALQVRQFHEIFLFRGNKQCSKTSLLAKRNTAKGTTLDENQRRNLEELFELTKIYQDVSLADFT